MFQTHNRICLSQVSKKVQRIHVPNHIRMLSLRLVTEIIFAGRGYIEGAVGSKIGCVLGKQK